MPAARTRKGKIRVAAHDGRRELIPVGKKLRFRLRDGAQREVVDKSQEKPSLMATLPLADNFKDDYAVIVSGNDYGQAGFHPVRLRAGAVTLVDLMLLPDAGTFRFRDALWSALRATHPKWTAFLKDKRSEDEADEHHSQWMEDNPEQLAAFLNFAEAMDDIRFRVGTGFDYLKRPASNRDGEQFLVDRFFAYADTALVEQVEFAVEQGTFETANSSLHPGATRSFKEVRFGEANIQITLHENDRRRIAGLTCLKVEIDMDYFRDPLAHLLLEVVPNQFGGATDPRQIYMLRWIAGRRAGVPEFSPPYHIA